MRNVMTRTDKYVPLAVGALLATSIVHTAHNAALTVAIFAAAIYLAFELGELNGAAEERKVQAHMHDRRGEQERDD